MGADFKQKAKKSFEKCWDKAALQAHTPDLFSKASDHAPHRFEAEAIGGAVIVVGETVAARVENGALICRRGLLPVLKIANPSVRLVQSFVEGCNIARADVVAADRISGVFEVTIS